MKSFGLRVIWPTIQFLEINQTLLFPGEILVVFLDVDENSEQVSVFASYFSKRAPTLDKKHERKTCL